MDFLKKIPFTWMFMIELRIVSYLRNRLSFPRPVLTPVKVNVDLSVDLAKSGGGSGVYGSEYLASSRLR